MTDYTNEEPSAAENNPAEALLLMGAMFLHELAEGDDTEDVPPGGVVEFALGSIAYRPEDGVVEIEYDGRRLTWGVEDVDRAVNESLDRWRSIR